MTFIDEVDKILSSSITKSQSDERALFELEQMLQMRLEQVEKSIGKLAYTREKP